MQFARTSSQPQHVIENGLRKKYARERTGTVRVVFPAIRCFWTIDFLFFRSNRRFIELHLMAAPHCNWQFEITTFPISTAAPMLATRSNCHHKLFIYRPFSPSYFISSINSTQFHRQQQHTPACLRRRRRTDRPKNMKSQMRSEWEKKQKKRIGNKHIDTANSIKHRWWQSATLEPLLETVRQCSNVRACAQKNGTTTNE